MTHLTFSERIRLQGVKARFGDRDEADRPAWLTEAIGDDGSIRVRPMTMTDLLDYVERECRGDVS